MVSSFFNSNNSSGSVLKKTGGFALNWPPVAYELYPSGRQSHANCHRVAASRMQNEKIDRNLPATGGHPGTICMRLATSRMLFLHATAIS
jgi:hypothetical protein